FPGQDYGRILESARNAGMGAIIIRVLAGGALSGSDQRHPRGVQVVAPIGSGADYHEDVERARRFGGVLAGTDVADTVGLAIRYVATSPLVSTLQVGIATPDEFERGARAVVEGGLSAATLERIGQLQRSFAG
ncbi:MAG: hypothetical protein JSS20_20625, partial [Proteobacteria bacterium]|nr:hypothetical protein [Pseudomonadota bacterium]